MEAATALLGDDLTGSADAAVAFARPGRPVPLYLSTPGPATGTFALDLDVRTDVLPDEVRARYRVSAAPVADQDLFLKIDSTLRGPVGPALEGVAEAFPDRPMVCAPAFPAQGRTVQQGRVLVHGAPLATSGIWAAEAGPVPATLADVLPTGLTSIRLGLDDVRSGAIGELLAARERPAVIVCDATTDADLEQIVASCRAAVLTPLVWVGSGGLARAVSRHSAQEAPDDPPAAPPTAGSGPGGAPPDRLLAVIGSASDIARAEARELADHGAAWFPVSADELTYDEAGAVRAGQPKLLEAVRRGPVVVCLVADQEPRRPGPQPAQAHLVRALARLVAPAAATADLLLLTGGATARAVLTACSVRRLEVERELQPGVVLSTVRGPRKSVVTKAGAFAGDHAFARLLDTSLRPNEAP